METTGLAPRQLLERVGGSVRFSTPEQAQETAAKHFAGVIGFLATGMRTLYTQMGRLSVDECKRVPVQVCGNSLGLLVVQYSS